MQTRTRSYVYPLKHSVQKNCSGLLTSCITEPKESRNYCKYFYKITTIVRALWLVERRVCMRVCKHGCEVKMFCFSHANHASTNLKKVSSWKTRQVYFIYQFPRRLKLQKSLETCCVNFFSLELKTRILESIFFAKQRLITRTRLVYKTSWLVRISLLIIALNKRVLLFSRESYFIKAKENFFSCVCISWYKRSRGWENSRQLGKPSTSSRVCMTASNSPNPSRVYMRLCKHGKRFLLLKKNLVIKNPCT